MCIKLCALLLIDFVKNGGTGEARSVLVSFVSDFKKSIAFVFRFFKSLVKFVISACNSGEYSVSSFKLIFAEVKTDLTSW